jgi:hypothetical protein
VCRSDADCRITSNSVRDIDLFADAPTRGSLTNAAIKIGARGGTRRRQISSGYVAGAIVYQLHRRAGFSCEQDFIGIEAKRTRLAVMGEVNPSEIAPSKHGTVSGMKQLFSKVPRTWLPELRCRRRWTTSTDVAGNDFRHLLVR